MGESQHEDICRRLQVKSPTKRERRPRQPWEGCARRVVRMHENHMQSAAGPSLTGQKPLAPASRRVPCRCRLGLSVLVDRCPQSCPAHISHLHGSHCDTRFTPHRADLVVCNKRGLWRPGPCSAVDWLLSTPWTACGGVDESAHHVTSHGTRHHGLLARHRCYILCSRDLTCQRDWWALPRRI